MCYSFVSKQHSHKLKSLVHPSIYKSAGKKQMVNLCKISYGPMGSPEILGII